VNARKHTFEGASIMTASAIHRPFWARAYGKPKAARCARPDDPEQYFLYRRGKRGRHGPPFPGFFGRGPRAGRGDIRAGILALLAEAPMHGYQIMRELTERSGGVWQPSPGSVYPTLQQLQDEGLVRGEEGEGGRRMFHLTEAGTEAAKAVTEGGAPWEALAAERDVPALELRNLVFQVMGAARQVVYAGNPAQLEKAMEVLRETRRRLYRILADEPEDTPPANA
jgi:DNA-binding PadR family transcriptional regulator